MYNVRQIKKQKCGVYVSVSSDLPIAEFATQEQAMTYANERNELLIKQTDRVAAYVRACIARRNYRKAA